MLTGEEKYKAWLLEYVDAWRDRMIANKNIIPTKIGLDGKIGGPDGKWYGGVYGWGFSVVVPQDGTLAHRNVHHKGFTGFANAYLLTGDDRYLDPWRKQIDAVNAAAKATSGQTTWPRMHGDQGWYEYVPAPYDYNAAEIAYLSMRPEDRRLLAPIYEVKGEIDPTAPYRDVRQHSLYVRWLEFLDGTRPDYPVEAMRQDLGRLRQQMEAVRNDPTTPDTRLADDPMVLNPCSVGSLVHLALGGVHPGKQAAPLHCRVRYYDPLARRAGLPPDVAALVERLTAESAVVQLVNVNQLEERTLVLLAGAYGEHEFVSVDAGQGAQPVDARLLTVKLSPGAAGRIELLMKRYVYQPTLRMPW
jgi:hypothetical protein